EKFLSLVAQSNPHSENCEAATVSYFANKLSVHPNYLSTVVKNISGCNALCFIHELSIETIKSHRKNIIANAGAANMAAAINLLAKQS
ncbi:MAG: hypothetical protein H7Y13_13540, partial [Sphingobacteriaceae bacterium]|nr:hypothetical protein [Sphingobacteriaceae bacterium]